MPTIQSMELPLPKNWQDFESIVCDAQALRWKSTTLQKNGRSGQKQNGVDIYGPDDIGRRVGIQCKRYKSPLGLKDVTDEIHKAEKGFKGQLTTLFFATTADCDAKLQEQVRLLSDNRVAQGLFSVALLYWDDIVSGLLLNPAVFRAHYPQIVLTAPIAVDRERLVAALELGYFGAEIWAYIQLIYGEIGWLAQSDPDEVIATLRILERRTQQLLPPDDSVTILESLAVIRDVCLSEKKASSDWDKAQIHANRVQLRLRKASSLLSLAESNVLDVGISLGRIYHHADDIPVVNIRADIKTKVRSVLPEISDASIENAFISAKKLKSGYRWAGRIYTFLDHQIRFRL